MNEVLKSTAGTLDKEHKWKECVGHVLYPTILTDPNRLRTRAEEAKPRNKVMHSLFGASEEKGSFSYQERQLRHHAAHLLLQFEQYGQLRWFEDRLCLLQRLRTTNVMACLQNVCFSDGSQVTTFQNITLFKFKTVQNVF